MIDFFVSRYFSLGWSQVFGLTLMKECELMVHSKLLIDILVGLM